MRSGASLSFSCQRGRNPRRADRVDPPFIFFCLPPLTTPSARTRSIYLLNLCLAFSTPKFDPALEADLAETDAEEGAPTLPTSKGDVQEDGEFRPFIRRLPEFKFWCDSPHHHLLQKCLVYQLVPHVQRASTESCACKKNRC